MHRLRHLHAELAPAAAPAALAAAQEELLTPTPGSSDEWAATHPAPSLGGASGLSDGQLNEWCSRGMVVLPEEQMGLPPGWHDRLREAALTQHYGMYDFCNVLPIGELLTAPGVEAGVASLLGPNWAVVPFANGSAGGNKTGPADGRPGGDQHWHKDDNMPFNSRKMRHHRPIQLEILYYPQQVKRTSGATGTIPYSHYWHHDHEENNDNFAGADHLDLDFMYGRFENNDDIEERDRRLNAAVLNTGWPLVRQHHAVLPAPASMLLMSHNLFHRGARREDTPEEQKELPRFMFRFMCYRTTDPKPVPLGGGALTVEESHKVWTNTEDHMTGISLSDAPPECTIVWDDVRAWIKGEAPPSLTPAMSKGDSTVRDLFEQLGSKGEHMEPQRMGAAYSLARFGKQSSGYQLAAAEALGKGCSSERESMRRASMYGAGAMGGEVMAAVLLPLMESDAKWRRKAATFALGEGAPLTRPVVDALCRRLKVDESVYVRAVSAVALGCLYRRSVATTAAGTGTGVAQIDTEALQSQVIDALMTGLAEEQNRLDQGMRLPSRSGGGDRAFGLKMWRPNDENDVCEGGAVTPPTDLLADKGMAEDRFARVRSTVRENIGWSLCMVTTHKLPQSTLSTTLPQLVDGLVDTISTDQNIISVGFAMDALHRLTRHGYAEALQACAAAMDPKRALCPAESFCRTQDGAGPLPSCNLG